MVISMTYGHAGFHMPRDLKMRIKNKLCYVKKDVDFTV